MRHIVLSGPAALKLAALQAYCRQTSDHTDFGMMSLFSVCTLAERWQNFNQRMIEKAAATRRDKLRRHMPAGM